jgi:asparagine synthase (glutamine-hydrolysing)
VALMQKQSARPVRTFTIGFNEAVFNEAKYAKEVAEHLGTDHTELYVTPAEAMAVVPRLPALYDEPFGDSSQIPTFLVSSLARRSVTVSLSGDGGDELFGGYYRYIHGQKLWAYLQRMPRSARRAMTTMIYGISTSTWDKVLRVLEPMLGTPGGAVVRGDRMHKLGDLLHIESRGALYDRLASRWHGSSLVVGHVAGMGPTFVSAEIERAFPNIIEYMMFLDLVTYLPGDILTKVDRAAMGASLESRAPFLDHRVAEFAWRLPLELKLRQGKGKWLVRQLLAKYVPTRLTDRPKMGFGVPIGEWIRGPMRGWAETLLDEKRIREEGLLNSEPIQKMWHEHLSGVRNWQHDLWSVLMFEAWRQSALD